MRLTIWAIDQPPARPTNAAEADLQDEPSGDRDGQSAFAEAARHPFDQHQGQEDGDGIVRSGLDFERRAHPVAERDAADPKQEEDRRRVGRRDDRAEQEAAEERQTEQKFRGDADEQRRQDDADRRQGDRRQGGRPQRRQPRLEAGVEKDDGKGDRPDEERRPGIVEVDAERPVLAGKQADDQKDEEQRRAEAEADEAGEHRRQDERGADEYCNLQRFRASGRCFPYRSRFIRID